MALVDFLASVPCVQYASFFRGEDYRRNFRFSPASPFVFFSYFAFCHFLSVSLKRSFYYFQPDSVLKAATKIFYVLRLFCFECLVFFISQHVSLSFSDLVIECLEL